MNPEIRFLGRAGDYGCMEVDEYEYAVMTDYYGRERTYSLDVINAPGIKEKARPVILFIHGGAFIEPCDRKQAYIARFARVLTEHGFTVVSPDYPVYKNEYDRDSVTVNESADCCRIPAQAVLKAAEYLRLSAKSLCISPSRMVIMGGSAGGMAAFYAVSSAPAYFKGFINLWGAPLELPDVTHFPPVLSIHGTADTVVPYERENDVRAALLKAGVKNRLIPLKDCGHTPLGCFDEFMPEILKFISELGD